MPLPAIEVQTVGKRYVLAHEVRSDTLRDALHGGARALWRRLRRRREEREEFWALRDVSFSVAPGEVVGIIGRNGAGKSTLLKIVSRITEPTQGRIALRGRVASLLEVGTGFHPELSGRENIYLNGAILGMRRAEIQRKFDEIVAFAEIERFLDTPVKRYSSGMYVRLAFAVAAHLEPEILIVDEVLAVGDAQFQQKCLGKMQDVARGEGRTVLVVSHNAATLLSLCTRGVLLHEGRLVTEGRAADVIATYLNAPLPASSRRASTSGAGIVDLACHFTPESHALEIDLTVHAERPLPVALEFLLTDQLNQPVAFAQQGTLDPVAQFLLATGENRFRFAVPVPSLASGRYRLKAQLLRTGGVVLDRLEFPVPLEIVGRMEPGESVVFQQHWGSGCVRLPLTPRT